MSKLEIDKKLALFLIISFIIATVIGTLSHELGHCVVAKYYGYEVFVHSSTMHWKDKTNDTFVEATYEKYKDSIKYNTHFDFPEKKRYDQISTKQIKDDFWISAGGPIQTMLFGTIGFLLLFFFKKSFINIDRLSLWQWILVFTASFWLRQVANYIMWIGKYILTGKWSRGGDEIILASSLGISNWSIIAPNALIGVLLLSIVYSKFIPKPQRFTFLIAGLIGGVLGFVLWLIVLGPMLMP